jgi:hypothetical protein
VVASSNNNKGGKENWLEDWRLWEVWLIPLSSSSPLFEIVERFHKVKSLL